MGILMDVCIDVDEVGTGIRLLCGDSHMVETDIPCVSDEESFGRQVAPHRCLRIFLLFLVLDGIVNMCHFIDSYATLMMDGHVADCHILDGMTRKSRDATTH